MKVFISHSHKDKPLARKLAGVLEDAGFAVWHDELVLPGDNWAKEIAKNLEESDAMVLLLTPDGLKSKNVYDEMTYALGARNFSHRLIPVVIGSPEDYSEQKIPWILRRLNLIKVPGQGNDEEVFRQITQALQDAA
ncbi:MAG TPA: toll/interleukin-1 receptor domain-containing protein [Pyrinomonadaceae bacterium]|nr:toll/interleukin-1 receptor domain-containing protein [Pyrinomonadaceae bacterium]